MIAGTLQRAATITGGRLAGADAPFTGVSTDTRTLSTGQLFVALKGERYDAHDVVAEAAARGAVGVIVEREVQVNVPRLMVDSSRQALADLARAWREHHAIPVIGVTGSNGKTTTKEMTAAILRRRGKVLATTGNLNNEIGVPLTLFGLDAVHATAVIEMGASGPDDISVLAAIARQTIGIITMCGPAHLLGFGSIANVAAAKGRMVATLTSDGVAVLNADDSYFAYWCEVSATRDIRSFGTGERAAYRARDLQMRAPGAGLAFVLESPLGSIDIDLPFDGRHNVYNALAAAAAALAAGATLEDVKLGLRDAHRVHGRLEITSGPRESVIIDDSYNANPASLAAAIAVLAQARGARWMVLGDMGELGPEAQNLHREAAEAARRGGVSRLFTIGVLAGEAARAFGDGAKHFENLEDLAGALESALDSDVTLLVKGSRAMGLDALVSKLRQKEGETC